MRNLLDYRTIAVWGRCPRGEQIAAICAEMGAAVKVYIDSDERKRDGQTISFESYGKEYDGDDSCIIIASLNPTSEKEILDQIKEAGIKSSVINNYEFHDHYENPHLLRLNEGKGYEVDFESYFGRWIDNIDSEVRFWKESVVNPEGLFHRDYVRRITNRQFSCDRLEGKVKAGNIVLDVGCGVCSQYGNLVGEDEIKLLGIDPLAPFYNRLNENNAGGGYREVVFGLFELLSYQFRENYCDYILIDNALDHCIDPAAAIMECLNILKPGGTLSLFHHRNEGHMEHYVGLHQWNISNNEKGEFIIWNEEQYADISAMLEEYADIRVKIEPMRGISTPYGCIRCTLTKKKDIPLNMRKCDDRIGFVLEKMMGKIEALYEKCN